MAIAKKTRQRKAAKPKFKGGRFEVYKARNGEYRWTLFSKRGNKIADSGEGYTSKTGALKGIKALIGLSCCRVVDRDTGHTHIEAR